MKKPTDFTKRRSDTTSIRDAIDSMLESYKIKDQYNANRLIGSWESMMGKPIAKRTDQLFVKDQILFVKLNSAPLRQELTIAKSKVLEIIHRHFDKELVADVKFL
jgi:predicted nucleic acid-binding Zn ribbon protein